MVIKNKIKRKMYDNKVTILKPKAVNNFSKGYDSNFPQYIYELPDGTEFKVDYAGSSALYNFYRTAGAYRTNRWEERYFPYNFTLLAPFIVKYEIFGPKTDWLTFGWGTKIDSTNTLLYEGPTDRTYNDLAGNNHPIYKINGSSMFVHYWCARGNQMTDFNNSNKCIKVTYLL